MKSLREMTRAEIERAADKAHTAHMAIIDEMIAAGRGLERPSETRLKDDQLSRNFTESINFCQAISDECRRRMAFHGNLNRTPA